MTSRVFEPKLKASVQQCVIPLGLLSLLEPASFIAPWLAHALGTLAGACLAAKVAASHKMKFALGIGVFFLLGGIMMVSMFGGPVWFNVLDLIGAYLPMGYLGGMLGGAKTPPPE